jgi:hypothetical protein
MEGDTLRFLAGGGVGESSSSLLMTMRRILLAAIGVDEEAELAGTELTRELRVDRVTGVLGTLAFVGDFFPPGIVDGISCEDVRLRLAELLGTVRVDASRVIHDVIQSVIQMIESSC